MSVPRKFFENRQSCWKHPRNAWFLRGFLWTPGSPVPEPSAYELPKTDWWLYIGPFKTHEEAGMFNFLVRRWAFQNGFYWWQDNAKGGNPCIWGSDPANKMAWPTDQSIQYTWVYEPPQYPPQAVWRKYLGLPGKYSYQWEGPTSHKDPDYAAHGLPGWTGI